jgi:hypothetical protein
MYSYPTGESLDGLITHNYSIGIPELWWPAIYGPTRPLWA